MTHLRSAQYERARERRFPISIWKKRKRHSKSKEQEQEQECATPQRSSAAALLMLWLFCPVVGILIAPAIGSTLDGLAGRG